jgi:hypothetical protein
MSDKTSQVFANFTANLIPFYYVIVPFFMSAGGDYLEDIDKDEKIFMTIYFSFFFTAVIWLFRGVGEMDFSSGYFVFGLVMAFFTVLSWRSDVNRISDGINRSKYK